MTYRLGILISHFRKVRNKAIPFSINVCITEDELQYFFGRDGIQIVLNRTKATPHNCVCGLRRRKLCIFRFALLRAKLSRAAVPEGNPLGGLLLSPPNPIAQPSAALLRYGCGIPLAGTLLGFGGDPKVFSLTNPLQKFEIHKVFLHFRIKFVMQNSSPNLLAELCGIALGRVSGL